MEKRISNIVNKVLPGVIIGLVSFLFLTYTDTRSRMLKGKSLVFGSQEEAVQVFATTPELQIPYLQLKSIFPGVTQVIPTITEAEREARNIRFEADIKEVLPELQAATEGMNDVQKLIALNDWMCDNIDLYEGDKGSLAYTAGGVLWKREGTCQGISLLYLRLSQELGVEGVSCIYGTTQDGEPHLRNTYCGTEIDVTANIARNYNIILLSGKNDYPDSVKFVESEDEEAEVSDIDYYALKGAYIKSVEEVKDVLANTPAIVKISRENYKAIREEIKKHPNVRAYDEDMPHITISYWREYDIHNN